jgi:drug/metabolite transporter (DMT)-like permease
VSPEGRAPVAGVTIALTAIAMVAFASNSILTRLALGGGHVDAASFTAVRLACGAATLVAIARWQSGGWTSLRGRGAWAGAVALFAYAAPFSYAYLRIGAAAGALVLFGAVQLTMIGWGIARGERPGARAWLGLALAAAGLIALLLPSAARPDPLGAGLMALAGVAWGVYSLRGRSAGEPLAANARSFLASVPLALLLGLVTSGSAFGSARGFALAAVSGAVTSGLGYAIWYRALRGLAATQAAIVQLGVPVIAAVGAVAVLGERPSARLAASGAAVIGGVALALTAPGGGGARGAASASGATSRASRA